MHHFHFRENTLLCEDVPVKEIAAKVGTPFYLYSHATLKRHFQVFSTAFSGIDNLICYSAKANSNQAILRLFADLGCGLDIVSGGELYRGLKAGFTPERVVYSGVGKNTDEIDFALREGIRMFNVESLVELELINDRAGLLDKRAPIAIRVNPNVDPKTHPYISTGLKKNKFGLDAEAALDGYRRAMQMDHVEVVGVACHIGSQITEADPFDAALNTHKAMFLVLQQMSIHIKDLDVGGGRGITYADETPPPIEAYANSIIEQLKDLDLTLVLEPGRVLVGNAGILVTRVLFRKSGSVKNFIIVDAGMNDLMRPTLYNAFHAIEPVVNSQKELIVADVVGPICESSDFLAVDRSMVSVDGGDLLAIMSAGAYGYVMSSNYCSRPRVAEVMVKEGQFHIVKARENYEDLVRGETLPPFLEG